MCHHAKFNHDRPNGFGDIAIFFLFLVDPHMGRSKNMHCRFNYQQYIHQYKIKTLGMRGKA